MRFEKLVVENYRVFYGRQEIYLYPPADHPTKNLILFGGLNGAGKTSLLNAFHLLLFGGNLIPKSEYKTLLSSALNNKHFAEGGNTASLALYITGKESFSIHLKLYFDKNQQYTHDERYLVANRQRRLMTDFEFRRFIERKIPTEVAPFFIFDGEKIQDLVERQENGELKKAIQNVVSLDLYKSALNHLREAHRIIAAEAERAVSSIQVNSVKSELEQKDSEIQKDRERIEEFNKKIKQAEEQREHVRQIMQAKLVNLSGSKAEFKTKIALKQKELHSIQKQLDEFKSKVPLFLVKNMIEQFKNRIRQEQKKLKIEQQQTDQFKHFELFIQDLLQKMEQANVSRDLLEQLADLARQSWAKVYSIRIEQPPEIDVIHANDLSQSDLFKILGYKIDDGDSITKLLDQKYRLEEEIQQLKEQQEKAPEALDVSKEERAIDQYSARIGELVTKKRTLERKLLKAEEERSRLQRRYTQLLEQASKSPDLQRTLSFSNRAVSLMEKFVERVTAYKAQQISNEFADIISKIFRKKDDFHSIEFDPREYKIKIKNEHGNPVSLANRSAGEKQLIALALIWALTKCANIQLPFVIDTPLGRLDSVHRENLAKHYFPHLSDQVIVLSTDTEVHDQYLEQLKNSIRKQYVLDYDQIEKVTTIREGYF